jgi:oligopeptidase A
MSFLSPAFLPDWALLTPEQVEPDIRRAIDTARARIAAFRLLTGTDLTYSQVLLGLEDATRELDHAWGLVSHLDSVLNSPALRKAYNTLLPDITAFYTSITLDAEVWSVLRAYSQTPEAKGLQGVRARFLEETLNSFLDQGAELGADGKLRLAAINARLAEVTQRYSENVLDSTNAWELIVTDAARLRGLPESALAAARQSAASKGHADA